MTAEDHAALVRLNEDFCFELDRGTPEGFATLFTEDAHYTHGRRESHGREAILAFARSRGADGPRTSRHVQSGLRLTGGGNAAEGTSSCVTWAASAAPPIADTSVLLVADFHDRYARIDGRWLIARRHIEPIFVPAPMSRRAHG